MKDIHSCSTFKRFSKNYLFISIEFAKPSLYEEILIAVTYLKKNRTRKTLSKCSVMRPKDVYESLNKLKGEDCILYFYC